jgi:hypothetical protein
MENNLTYSSQELDELISKADRKELKRITDIVFRERKLYPPIIFTSIAIKINQRTIEMGRELIMRGPLLPILYLIVIMVE